VSIPGRLLPATPSTETLIGARASRVSKFAADDVERFRSVLHGVFTPPVTASTPYLARRLADTAAAVLTGAANRGVGHRAIPRAAIVRRAVHHLHDRDGDGEPVSVPELADAAGVSERTLRTAFREYYRTGPHHFLKMRRLHRANRALRSADPQSGTVTQVATGLGVCELGKFARDYRMLFGESPSVTLRGRTSVILQRT
jgi:AraC-like DNA-binding protein